MQLQPSHEMRRNSVSDWWAQQNDLKTQDLCAHTQNRWEARKSKTQGVPGMSRTEDIQVRQGKTMQCPGREQENQLVLYFTDSSEAS